VPKYPKIGDGDPVRLSIGKYGKRTENLVDVEAQDVLSFACCDCGMVHQFVPIRINSKEINVHIVRQDRSTAQLRRHRFGNLHDGVGKWKIVENA